MSSASCPVPIYGVSKPKDWVARINRRADLLNFCISTNNFTPFDSILASDAIDPIDHLAILREACIGTGVDGEGEIKEAAITASTEGKNNFSDYKGKVENIPKSGEKTKKSWKDRVNKAADEAIKANTDAVNKARKKAIDVIDKIPEGGQDAAATIWEKAIGTVTGFFNLIGVQLTRVFEAIAEFFVGIWNKMKQAWETVKDGFTAAWNAIKGIFSITEMSKTSTFSKVTSELGALLDELVSEELDVDQITVQKTADGWKMLPAGWEGIPRVITYE